MLSDFVAGQEDPGNGTHSILELKWAKDVSFVQVGVRDMTNSWIQTTHVSADPGISSRSVSALTQPAVVESLWVSFQDRASINQAIRLLRRARDGAFGRDE